MAVTLLRNIAKLAGTAAERAAYDVSLITVGSTYFEWDTSKLYILAPTGWVEKNGTVQIDNITAGTSIIGKVGIDQTTPGSTNAVALTGSNAVIDCVIAKDGTVSTEADISKYKYFSFLMPAGWDSATLTIKGSAAAGGTKQAIKNDLGQTFPLMTVAVDTIYSIDAYAVMLASVQFISFVASAAQTTAARTIKLMCKA